VTFEGHEDVIALMTPPLITLTETAAVDYLLLVTNTGSVSTWYSLTVGSDPPGLPLEAEISRIYIPPHMTAGILVTARPESGGVYTVTVETDSTSSDVTGQAQARLEVAAPEPVLHLAKNAAPAAPLAGGLLTYTITVSNTGGAAAEGIVVSDVLPSQVQYAADNRGGSYSTTTHQLLWEGWSVGAGGEISATVVVTIGAEVTPTTVLTNSAYLYYGTGAPLAAQSVEEVAGACMPLTGVTLTVVTAGGIYTTTAVGFSADVAPDSASKPYGYEIRLDAAPWVSATSEADPLVFSTTFGTTGTHYAEIAVWNCEMAPSEALTATLDVEVIEELLGVYLPIIVRGSEP
jgi:uncharacterized repeat protein (TIGR01451 family)